MSKEERVSSGPQGISARFTGMLLLLVACGGSTTFPPEASIPLLTSAEISGITPTSALAGGNISSDGGAAVTSRGTCWSTNSAPTISDNSTNDGAGAGSFTSALSGLLPSTTYFVRAYATNSAGTGYGSTVTFTTSAAGDDTVTDIDGNVYRTVTIGGQTWMAENLRTTRYRNGDPVPNVSDDSVWFNLSTGAYCNYGNDPNYAAIYGRLYNWYAVYDSRNIAPSGWHVASDDEWTTLVNYLGGPNIAGGKLKEAGTSHWKSPNAGATNESGFSGLPGGYRNPDGPFHHIGDNGFWWTSTLDNTYANRDRAWRLTWHYFDSTVDRNSYYFMGGMSVRCIKDLPQVPVATLQPLKERAPSSR